jgi:hypothetical protein
VAVWFIGGLLSFSYYFYEHYKFYVILHRARRASRGWPELVERLARPLRVRRPKIAVIGSPIPYVLPGIPRPWLVLPQHLSKFTIKEQAQAITHELAHIGRGDHHIAVVELVIRCVWWWNPLVPYVLARLDEYAEIASDGWVAEYFPGARREGWGQLVVAIAGGGPYPPMASPLSGPANAFLRRLREFGRFGREPVRFLLAAALLAFILPGWSRMSRAIPAAVATGSSVDGPVVDDVNSQGILGGTRRSIRITRPAPRGGGEGDVGPIAGRASGPDLADCKVVLYAWDGNKWWVQPFVDHPDTKIGDDGTWEAEIHLGRRYAALLVRSSYRPAATLAALPEIGGDILAISRRLALEGTNTDAQETRTEQGRDAGTRGTLDARAAEGDGDL